jgi:hypothetical protein
MKKKLKNYAKSQSFSKSNQIFSCTTKFTFIFSKIRKAHIPFFDGHYESGRIWLVHCGYCIQRLYRFETQTGTPFQSNVDCWFRMYQYIGCNELPGLLLFLVSMGKAGLVKFLVTFLDIGNFCIIFGY